MRREELNRPLAGWEALDVVPVPRPRALGHAPFVGRDHELDVLVGALGRVLREERPQLVSVLGEPGIGKSRLIAEFERAFARPGERAGAARTLRRRMAKSLAIER